MLKAQLWIQVGIKQESHHEKIYFLHVNKKTNVHGSKADRLLFYATQYKLLTVASLMMISVQPFVSDLLKIPVTGFVLTGLKWLYRARDTTICNVWFSQDLVIKIINNLQVHFKNMNTFCTIQIEVQNFKPLTTACGCIAQYVWNLIRIPENWLLCYDSFTLLL